VFVLRCKLCGGYIWPWQKWETEAALPNNEIMIVSRRCGKSLLAAKLLRESLLPCHVKCKEVKV